MISVWSLVHACVASRPLKRAACHINGTHPLVDSGYRHDKICKPVNFNSAIVDRSRADVWFKLAISQKFHTCKILHNHRISMRQYTNTNKLACGWYSGNRSMSPLIGLSHTPPSITVLTFICVSDPLRSSPLACIAGRSPPLVSHATFHLYPSHASVEVTSKPDIIGGCWLKKL